MLTDLVLTGDGLGTLRVGSPPPVTDPAVDILVFDPRHCDPKQGDPGLWIPNYTEPESFRGSLGKDRTTVTAITLVRLPGEGETGVSAVRTDTGIGLGSSLADLEAAYPAGFVQTASADITDVCVASSGAGSLVFEVSKNVPVSSPWDPDQIGQVRLIRTDQAAATAQTTFARDAPIREHCPQGL